MVIEGLIIAMIVVLIDELFTEEKPKKKRKGTK